MPNTKSATKALRQSVRKRTQNLTRKESYKKLVKEIKKLSAASKTAEAAQMIPKLYKALDKAAKTNAIKWNKASRLKSRITKSVQKSTK